MTTEGITEERIVKDITEILVKNRVPRELITPEVDLISRLGVDSMFFWGVMAEVEELYNVPYDFDFIENSPEDLRTIKGISSYLLRRIKEQEAEAQQQAQPTRKSYAAG